MSKNHTLLRTGLIILAILGTLVALLAIIAPDVHADWKHLTFHEPAHYLFEFQNELVVGLILIPLWQRAKARAVREAIVKHDAEHHPYSHRVDSDPERVVG